MEQKLYYTRQELFSQPHTRFIETEYSICFNILDGEQFINYKKLYLLQKNAPDVTEIYVEDNIYDNLKSILTNPFNRYVLEFEGCIFFSIKDFIKCIDYANNHKLF